MSSLLDSAPPVLQRMTVDRPFGVSPNRRDSAIATISAERPACKPLSPGLPKLPGSFGPATHGLRTSTKNKSSLATASAAVKQLKRVVRALKTGPASVYSLRPYINGYASHGLRDVIPASVTVKCRCRKKRKSATRSSGKSIPNGNARVLKSAQSSEKSQESGVTETRRILCGFCAGSG